MILRLVICPRCGRIQPISKKRGLLCSSCEESTMEPIKLTFDQYSTMTPKERKDYITGWMYIRRKDRVSNITIFKEKKRTV